jgi:hypothetical protein
MRKKTKYHTAASQSVKKKEREREEEKLTQKFV